MTDDYITIPCGTLPPECAEMMNRALAASFAQTEKIVRYKDRRHLYEGTVPCAVWVPKRPQSEVARLADLPRYEFPYVLALREGDF